MGLTFPAYGASARVLCNRPSQGGARMFQPQMFEETRSEVMHDLMHAHPFAALVTDVLGQVTADHVPLVLHPGTGEHGALHGHIAHGNPLFRNTTGPIPALAIFQGPQGYVTPSWYPSKREHGKVVPTWNYVIVHARGILQFQQDPDWLMHHLHDLTQAHESHRPEPWQVSDAPEDFIQRQLRGLVGFELTITELSGVWKVSQNKTAADLAGVRDGLNAEGKADLSQLVAERARKP